MTAVGIVAVILIFVALWTFVAAASSGFKTSTMSPVKRNVVVWSTRVLGMIVCTYIVMFLVALFVRGAQ